MKSTDKPPVVVVVTDEPCGEQRAPARAQTADQPLQVIGKEFLGELGMRGLEELNALQRHLAGHADVEPMRFRFAPSIVCRSEAELLGLSMPRFAVRVYLDKAGSFVNARRLRTLCRLSHDSAALVQSSLLNPERSELANCFRVKDYSRELTDEWMNSSCIGDCLLVPPDRIRQDYHCLTVNLGTGYGEAPLAGTPFVRQISLPGGGLCAQAVCFMASALLHEAASTIYSPEEVPFIAANESDPNPVLSPFTPQDISRYFGKILGGMPRWQCIVDSKSSGCAAVRLREALRAYLLAGVPVVFPVNLHRMAKHSILSKAGIAVEDTFRAEDHVLNHVVLVVGCGNQPSNQSQFLFNDPASMPFLKATAEQLLDCAMGDPPNPEANPQWMFLPVTGPAVRVPIENWRDTTGTLRHGLLAVSQRLIDSAASNSSRWRLLRINDLTNRASLNLEEPLASHACSLLDRVMAEGVSMGVGNRWVWLQVAPRKLYLWDAEQELFETPGATENPTCDTIVHPNLLCVGDPEDWSLSVLRPFLEKSSEGSFSSASTVIVRDRESESSPKLQLSLISSFTARNLKEAFKTWPRRLNYCELTASHVASMEQDSGESAPGGLATHSDAPEKLFSECEHDDARIEAMAERLSQMAGAREVNIIGITTCFPQICSYNERTAVGSTSALKAIVKIARDLQRFGHHCSVITMVAGTRVQGLWPYRRTAGPGPFDGCVADRLSTPQAIDRLLIRLGAIAELIQRDCDEFPIRLALDLEPGPLFVLNSLEGAQYLCDALDSSETLSPFVGLNLDIAHYILARINVERLAELRRRIVHCHVSEHGHGHFADCVPGTVRQLEDYAPWMEFVQSLAEDTASRGPRYPSFSGFVSLNLEGCKSDVLRSSGIETLERFFRLRDSR